MTSRLMLAWFMIFLQMLPLSTKCWEVHPPNRHSLIFTVQYKTWQVFQIKSPMPISGTLIAAAKPVENISPTLLAACQRVP